MLKNYRVWKVKYKASRYSVKLALLQIKRNHNFFFNSFNWIVITSREFFFKFEINYNGKWKNKSWDGSISFENIKENK